MLEYKTPPRWMKGTEMGSLFLFNVGEACF